MGGWSGLELTDTLLFSVNLSAPALLTLHNRTFNVQALHFANFSRFLDLLSKNCTRCRCLTMYVSLVNYFSKIPKEKHSTVATGSNLTDREGMAT